jgi:site-specific DNA-methyltransferase (adenine-specific)
MPDNLLCFGDNAYFLNERRDLFPDESVDLVYLDPPFNSQRPYNILFKDHKGTPSAAQIKAFDDTWTWDETAQRNYEWLITDAGFAPEALRALISTFNRFLGRSEMFAYLVQMATRLVMLHRVLKPTGSLYLHCDPTASHYLKLVLDGVFGAPHFINEITWKRTSAHSDTKQGMKRCGKIRDIILFYSKTADYTWNPVYQPYDEDYVEAFYGHIEDDGRRFTLSDLTAAKPGGDTLYSWKGVRPYEGRFWAYSQEKMKQFEEEGRLYYTSSGMPRYKRYLDEMPGIPLQDLWTDIKVISSTAAERLGYPTQKPLALLKRIVAASSNPGDVVLDPFCGCGTTIDAVETLNRETPDQPPRTWMGIDVTHLAINLIKHRLARFEPAPKFSVEGEPEDLGGARELAARDRHQFQYWALGLIGARPAATDRKKGADRGIDGSFNFIDDAKGTARSVLVQVKSGKVRVGDIRDLKGVLEREQAEMGVFITLEQPTKPMVEEALSAGSYHSGGWGKDYPRIQILTIEELLADPDRPHPRCLRAPQRVLGETFKEARKHRSNGVEQLGLGG